MPVLGGAQTATETLVRALRVRGVDAVVVTRRYSAELPRFEIKDGVPVHRLGRPGHRKLNALTFAIETLWFLTVQERRLRLVHVQNIDTPLLIGILVRHLLRRHLVATIHGEAMIHGRRASRIGRLRLALMVRSVQAFTSINPANTAALVGVGVPRARIHEIPNAVDREIFRPPSEAERQDARARIGVPRDGVVAVYVGRLETYKRVDLLIDAWSRLRRPEGSPLVVVGSGPEDAHLRARAEALGVDVRFVGATEPLPYLWAADIYANASGDPATGWVEGLSVALIEAMSAGLAPAVTRCPGNDVLVVDGVTGLSFAMAELDSLTTSLQTLIDEPELRARLGREAAAHVAHRYSASAVAATVESLYRELDRHPAAPSAP
jgi:glycosyltransferase involved in cell wall biosynthesis